MIKKIKNKIFKKKLPFFLYINYDVSLYRVKNLFENLNTVIKCVCLPYVYLEIQLKNCSGTQKYVQHEPALKQ